jgi:hypothetical protein
MDPLAGILMARSPSADCPWKDFGIEIIFAMQE